MYLDRLETRFDQLKGFDKIEHDFGCVCPSELRRKLQTAELSVAGQRADNFAMASYDIFLHFSIFEKGSRNFKETTNLKISGTGHAHVIDFRVKLSSFFSTWNVVTHNNGLWPF